QPFYNAMMPELVPADEQGRLSGLGTALGYVGSVIGVALVIPFFNGTLPLVGQLGPQTVEAIRNVVPFTAHAGRVSTFLPTGLLFLLFSLPLFIYCRDHDPAPRGTRVHWGQAFSAVANTFSHATCHPGLLLCIG